MPIMTNAEIIEVVTAFEADKASGLAGLLEIRRPDHADNEWLTIEVPRWAFSQSEYRYTPAARMPVWVNLYGADRGQRPEVRCHPSREVADAYGTAARIACVMISPGDGLKDSE